MAWYWVKSGGSATGDGGRVTSQPTGSFATRGAANYYPSTQAARGATTAPATGDFIIISDTSDFTAAGDIESFDILEIPAFVICVSDTNADQSSTGAIERTAAGLDFALSAHGARNTSHGVTYFIGDELEMSFSSTTLILTDGGISFEGVSDRINIQGDGAALYLVNSNVIFEDGTATHVMQLIGGPTVEMVGGAITSTTGTIADLIGGSSASGGGMTVHLLGVDLTDVDGYLLADTGATHVSDDNFEILIDGCKLSATLTGFSEENFSGPGQIMRVVNSSSVAASAEYQYFYKTWTGDAEDQDSSGIVRTGGVTFESGEDTSLKISTTANCSIANPFTFELSGRYTKLSTASEDTLIIHFAVVNTVTLTDANFYAEVVNPNGTTANLWDFASNRNADILAAGTEWTDDSGSSVWEDNGVNLTGHNEYRMEIPISGGGDGYPVVRLSLTETSLAGTLYVSADIGVS